MDEIARSIEQEAEKIRNTAQHTAQDIDKPDDPEFRMYPEDDEVLYMRAWRGKDYIFVQDYNKSWEGGTLITFLTMNPKMTFFNNVRVGASTKCLGVFGDNLDVMELGEEGKNYDSSCIVSAQS